MFIKQRPSWSVPESEVTPESVYLNRRKFMTGAIASAAALSIPGLVRAEDTRPGTVLDYKAAPQFSTDEKPAPYEAITTYNNFYEFGTGKQDPSRYASEMSVDPWSVEVEGECANPGTYALEDLLKRSEEHTSELQSRPHLVCRLLLEKKKNKQKKQHH